MNQFFNFDVGTLQRWLTWELSSSTLFFISFINSFALYILAPVIFLFLPILIGTLWIERRHGWLIFFAIFVVLPAAAIYFVIDVGTWNHALQLFPLGLFFFYCFLLRLTVPMWDEGEAPESLPDFEI